MEGLYRPADNGSNELGVAAEEPTVSEDGLTYTFTIRDDADWSNGDPVTAQDFVYTYQKQLHLKLLVATPINSMSLKMRKLSQTVKLNRIRWVLKLSMIKHWRLPLPLQQLTSLTY